MQRQRAEVGMAELVRAEVGRADIASDIACFFSTSTLCYIGRLEGMPPSQQAKFVKGLCPPWGGGSVLGGSVRGKFGPGKVLPH